MPVSTPIKPPGNYPTSDINLEDYNQDRAALAADTVHFKYDSAVVEDADQANIASVAQASAGVGWGSMFIPRKGQEVVVEFLEGNPDRPLITGVVYNANVTVPYALPANKTRSTIKTSSSQGNNGYSTGGYGTGGYPGRR